MAYEGVKFETQFLNNQIPNDPRIEDLKFWCTEFDRLKLAPPYDGGSYGNLSFRVSDNDPKFIITSSNIALKEAQANDYYVTVMSCDLINAVVYADGVREPSSESMLHYAIYRERSDVKAIFHGHCDSLLANASKLGLIETKKESPAGTIQLVQSVLDIIKKHNFIILKNHGFISMGSSMEEAGRLAVEMLDKCAL